MVIENSNEHEYYFCIGCKKLCPVEETVSYIKCLVCDTAITDIQTINTRVMFTQKEAELRGLPVVKGES